MKNAASLLLALTLCLLLFGCASSSGQISSTAAAEDSPVPAVTTTSSENATVTEPDLTQPAAARYVYEGAVEDYLLPLEEYSWEREYVPEYVMLHFTSAVSNHRDDPYNIQHIRDIFTEYNLSIHYIVDRDGTVRCYIPENRVAWHAGKGEFAGDPKYTNNMNLYAIGIELVAIGSESDMATYLTGKEYQALDDSLKGFTQAQYDALKSLVTDLCERYHIPMDRNHIIGHDEYSPGKSDPGELFDWTQIIPAD